MHLSAKQVRYQRDGYPVGPGLQASDEITSARAPWGVDDFAGDSHRNACATSEQGRQAAGTDLLASGGGIPCFFEAEALDEQGRLRQAKALSINKIGHAPHDPDPLFDRASHGLVLAERVADLAPGMPLTAVPPKRRTTGRTTGCTTGRSAARACRCAVYRS